MASPLMIEIALWYHCRTTDYRDGDLTAPAVRDAIREFEERGMLQRSTKTKRKYECTEALTAWVDALCAVGWPVKTWVIGKAEPVRRPDRSLDGYSERFPADNWSC